MVYTMSDFHLPSSNGKAMDLFGWGDHVKKIKENWPLTEKDVIVIPGDLSWALKAGELLPDLSFIHSLPGRKILLKGNHDLWWGTSKKVEELLESYPNISFIFNTSMTVDGISLCGTRGWDITSEESCDVKTRNREFGRLKASLKKAETNNIVCFVHYPPLLVGNKNEEFHKIFLKYGVRKVFYGHLHGNAIAAGFQGIRDGISYKLVSADALDFKPIKIVEDKI